MAEEDTQAESTLCPAKGRAVQGRQSGKRGTVTGEKSGGHDCRGTVMGG